MKCPKCGYISFDYNQVCPKCNKDISSEQAKLNIPPFQPNTPSLLGALTGEVNESQIGLRVDTTNILEESLPQGIPGIVDSSIEDTGHFAFDDTDDSQIEFEGEEALESLSLGGDSEVELDGLDESALVEEESGDGFGLETAPEDEISLEETGDDLLLEPEEDFSLDLGDFSEEEEAELGQEPAVEAGETGPEDLTLEPGEIGAEDLTLELSKAKIDESVLSGEHDLEEPALEEPDAGIDLGDLEMGFDEAEEPVEAEKEEPVEEPELDLGDLGLEADLATQTQDTELKVDEIFLEETPGAAESHESISAKIESDTGIDLEALDELEVEIDETEKTSDGLDEIELDLEDLKVNETGELEIGAPPEPLEFEEAEEEEEPEEILLEDQRRTQAQEPLVGLEFEELPVEDITESAKPSGTAQGLEDTLIELEEISLSEEPIDESGESEMIFELENLDLDLEFEDEPEDDKKEK